MLHAYPRLPEVDAEGRGFDPRIVDDELRRAEKALLERSQELESRLGSRPKVRLVVGDAAASLLEAAEEDAPERTLLVVGSRGLGAIGRMRLGSVSTKVVHAAKGPVLVHPPLKGETYRSQHRHLNLESWLPDATEDDISLVSQTLLGLA